MLLSVWFMGLLRPDFLQKALCGFLQCWQVSERKIKPSKSGAVEVEIKHFYKLILSFMSQCT